VDDRAAGGVAQGRQGAEDVDRPGHGEDDRVGGVGGRVYVGVGVEDRLAERAGAAVGQGADREDGGGQAVFEQFGAGPGAEGGGLGRTATGGPALPPSREPVRQNTHRGRSPWATRGGRASKL